ncbi:MAG: PaaI family thioesterase [Thermoanaerobaculales bacterium]|nr:PaaI family thioesterase [Thermoanaerobaculales bacterium]
MQKKMLGKLARLFETTPFVAHLGMRFASVESGLVVLEVPFCQELIGNPELPALHGGVISALLDTCGGAAVWSQLGKGDRVSTVDLRVDYLRPGRAETLFGTGRVIRLGNRVGVAELRAFHEGQEDGPVAMGTGVYNIRRAGAADSKELWDHVEEDS